MRENHNMLGGGVRSWSAFLVCVCALLFMYMSTVYIYLCI